MPSVWFDGGALEQLRAYCSASEGAFAANTERARLSDSRIFAEWCHWERKEMLPARPETVAAFIDAMAVPRAPATVRRYISSISHLHRARGRRGSQKLGLTRDLVDRMIAASDRTSLKGLRDCALLSTAYDTLCRRSELVAADIEHLTTSDDGSGSLYLPTSKTDQEGNGAYRYLAPYTMRYLSAYLV